MFATLSYKDQFERKITVPYYELQVLAQERYEKEKQKSDFDFDTFEKQYTYFRPYLDYILLYKQGRLYSFLMEESNQIYSENHILYYSSTKQTRIHDQNVVPYLKSDDHSILLNQRNINYSHLLLNNAFTLSHLNATKHDLLIDFYLHQILSQNKDIATHYDNWKRQETVCEMDPKRKYILCYLGSFLFLDLGDMIWYIKSEGTETVAQTNWIHKTAAQPARIYKPTCEEIIVAKQFTKSFF